MIEYKYPVENVVAKGQVFSPSRLVRSHNQCRQSTVLNAALLQGGPCHRNLS